jgi:hypothetical protein
MPAMFGKALAVALTLTATMSVHAQCGGGNARESKVALRAVYTALLGDAHQAEAAVDQWMPETMRQIEGGTSDVLWYKAAMLMSQKLVEFDRADEARAALVTIAESKSATAGRWPGSARRRLAELDEKASRAGK